MYKYFFCLQERMLTILNNLTEYYKDYSRLELIVSFVQHVVVSIKRAK